jgi:hypothetical protein
MRHEPKHTTDSVTKYVGRRKEADHQVALAREVEKVSRMDQDLLVF